MPRASYLFWPDWLLPPCQWYNPFSRWTTQHLELTQKTSSLVSTHNWDNPNYHQSIFHPILISYTLRCSLRPKYPLLREVHSQTFRWRSWCSKDTFSQTYRERCHLEWGLFHFNFFLAVIILLRKLAHLLGVITLWRHSLLRWSKKYLRSHHRTLRNPTLTYATDNSSSRTGGKDSQRT